MGSYETTPEKALTSAIRMVKEGGMKGVKLEGGAEMASTIRKISQAGIPVMAHIGLTPQRQHSLGGFRVQGKSAAGAVKLLRDALAVQKAGACMVLIEAVPPEIASIITQRLSVPTIGIGSGNGCSGQVLVQVDMLGNFLRGGSCRSLLRRMRMFGGRRGGGLRLIGRRLRVRLFLRWSILMVFLRRC